MTSDSERKLRDAEEHLGIAADLLKKVIDYEWRNMDDSDCETETMIDDLESVCDSVQKQQSLLLKINLKLSTEEVKRAFPNALRLLEES